MPVWNFFQKLPPMRGRSKEQSTGEEIFTLATTHLQQEIVPDLLSARREMILHVLCEAESHVFAMPLQPLTPRFGRLWYDFLMRHDSFPRPMQLDDEQLLLGRHLILAFSQQAPGASRLAKQVLSLVDELFQTGNLAMCEVLLELFEANPHVDRTNERNIFFDRYARRIFDRRRKPLMKRELDALHAFAQEPDEERKRTGILQWLSETAHIDFLIRQPSPYLQETYRALTSPQQHALTQTIGRPLIYERLRPLRNYDDIESLQTSLMQRIVDRGAFHAVQHTLEAAYFIALSSGRHEADSLLFDTDPWLRDTINLDAATVLSDIHKQVRRQNRSIHEAFERSLRDHVYEWDYAARFDAERISSMIQALPTFIPQTDFQVVPEGLYDLEQFIALLAMNQPIQWRLRLCRLV